MAFDRDYSEAGIRWYDSDEPSLVRGTWYNPDQPNYKVYGFHAETDSVLHSDSVFAPGFDGDATIIGKTLSPGKHFMRFSRIKFTSGTGYVFLE